MKASITVNPPRVFAVQHPDMSEALIMEDIAGRTYRQIIVWAQMAIMQAFDVSLPKKSEWIVAPLQAWPDKDVSFDLFEDER